MKRVSKVFSIVLVVLIIVVIAGYLIIKSTTPVIEVGDVNLSSINDGVYTGEYSAGLVKAVVKVVVKDNVMTEIIIEEHDNGMGEPAEKITEEILRVQSIDVDAISGATLSSDVIRKAVEEALRGV